MYKFLCLSGHDFEADSANKFICPDCKRTSVLYWCTNVGQETWGHFKCNETSKTTLLGVDMGGGCCGFKYMAKDSVVSMCPKCNQLNRSHRVDNDKRAQEDQEIAEKAQRGEGWGQPEQVTHLRNINGKDWAVTNKGNVKDLKDTEYAGDRSGKRHAGMVDSTGKATQKAKKGFASRRDWDNL